jgi:phage-related protein
MASETLSFNIVGRDQGASAAFKRTGDSAELAARGARACAVALERQRKAADASVGATLALARADKLLADAEHGLNDEALRADFLAKKQAERAKSAAGGGGGGGAGGAGGRLVSGAGPGILGISGKLASLIAGGGALAAAVPAITAIGGAVATLGAGIGLLVGKGGPLHKQAAGLMKDLTATFRQAAGPLIAPLREAFRQIPGFLKQIGPLLKQVFGAAAPFIAPLLHGFEALVKGVLPGFVALLKAAGPAIRVLAGFLGVIGKNVGSVFKAFAPVIKDSAVVLKALSGVLAGILPVVGKVIAAFARGFAPVVKVLSAAFKALNPVILILGKIVAQFAVAAFKDLGGILTAVVTLIKGIAPSLKILGAVIGAVFQTLENTGVFAILANALEQIAKPLAGLINALVKGLAPILPPVIKLISAVSGELVKVLVAALKVVIPVLTKLVSDILEPLVPLINKVLVPLIGLLAKGLGTVLVAAIKVLKPVLDIIIKVIGYVATALAAVIKWVAGLAKNWRQAWADIKNWAADAWKFLTHGWGQFLVPGLTVIRKVIEFVRDHWRAAWDVIKNTAQAAWNWIYQHVIKPLKAAWDFLKGIVGTVFGGGTGNPNASPKQAAQYAASRLPSFGWSPREMSSLIPLWNRESGWNRLARNPTSGAYGIPQALPPSKMGAAANPPLSSAVAQINWGLSYIKGRYGSPSAAWGHETAYGWYDKGGMLPTGWSLAYNGTGRPEPVGWNNGGGGGVAGLTVTGGHSDFEQFMAKFIRKFVRVNYGGNVQAAFGS